MASRANHWKIGLFVALGVVAAIAAVLLFSETAFRGRTITFHTYFNESVTGLEVGAPVKFRGVTIGHVAAIEIAPDHRHVEVGEDLRVDSVERMGFQPERTGLEPRFHVPADLRAQLATQGITGIKFVAIDFFDERTNPLPELPFPPPPNYIPAAASLIKNLEDTAVSALESIPRLADAIGETVGRLDRMLATFETARVPDKTARALTHADTVLASAQRLVVRLDEQNVGEKTGRTLDELTTAVTKLNGVLDRMGGEAGLVATATHAAAQVGSAGRNAKDTTADLDETLREVRDAADAIRRLASEIERQPDILIKGRAEVKGKSQ